MDLWVDAIAQNRRLKHFLQTARVLRQHPGLPQNELAALAGVGPRAFRKQIKIFEEEGFLRYRPGAGRMMSTYEFNIPGVPRKYGPLVTVNRNKRTMMQERSRADGLLEAAAYIRLHPKAARSELIDHLHEHFIVNSDGDSFPTRPWIAENIVDPIFGRQKEMAAERGIKIPLSE